MERDLAAAQLDFFGDDDKRIQLQAAIRNRCDTAKHEASIQFDASTGLATTVWNKHTSKGIFAKICEHTKQSTDHERNTEVKITVIKETASVAKKFSLANFVRSLRDRSGSGDAA